MNDKEYKEWEDKIEKIKKHNNNLLSDFEKWLKSKDLKPKTIKNHIDNVEFYVNEFLLRYKTIPAENGALEIGSFLGDYFIRKTTWASKYTIQENIVSFNKFYTFLNEIGKIEDNDLKEMTELIKGEKDYWIEKVETYWDNLEKESYF